MDLLPNAEASDTVILSFHSDQSRYPGKKYGIRPVVLAQGVLPLAT